MLCLLFFLMGISGKLHAATITAPRSFEWRLTPVENQHLKMELLQGNSPTEIIFIWNQVSGDFDLIKNEDRQNNLVIPKPSRHIWTPHPGQHQSVEQIYLRALRELGYKNLEAPYVQIFPDYIAISDMESFLKKARAQFVLKALLFNQLKSSVKNENSATLTDLIADYSPFLGPSEQQTISQTLTGLGLNLVEAIKNQGNSETRIDAFTMTALNALEKDAKTFFSNLKNLVKDPKVCPADFLIDKSITWSTREGVMSLITHNHQSEIIAIKAAALKLGVDEGWQFALLINELYEKDRKCWLRQIGLESQSLFATRPPLNTALVILPSGYKIPHSLIYHFYGAFILARRFLRLGLPYSLVLRLNPYFGAHYKELTHPDPEIIKLYKSIYYEGALAAIKSL